MRWPWVSREWLDEMKAMLADERARSQNLLDTIIAMKKGGYDPVPWLQEQAWEGGKYVMADEEEDQPKEKVILSPETQTGTFTDERLEAELAEDLARAFPDED